MAAAGAGGNPGGRGMTVTVQTDDAKRAAHKNTASPAGVQMRLCERARMRRGLRAHLPCILDPLGEIHPEVFVRLADLFQAFFGELRQGGEGADAGFV